MELIDAINAELPQFQCGRCDTPGCGPYAKAISEGSPHNRCVPGGQETLDRLSILLKRDNLSLDDDYGPGLVSQTAVVIEEDCIGCKKCIDACPVDAIVGASNLMHSVLDDICTGCELCVEPCPVDCISMVEVSENQSDRARSSSSEYFDLKNLLSSRNLTKAKLNNCLLYTSPSPRDRTRSRMPSSA